VVATMAMPVLTEIEVTAPTTTATMTRPKIGTFVPPFTTGVPVSNSVPMYPNPQVRPRLDDRYITIQNLFREQPYGLPNSMMENLHNNVSASADHYPFTPFNTHSPSSSSVFGKSAIPALTTEFMMLFRRQMDESNHEMVNLLTQQIDTVFNPLIQSTNQSYQTLATQMGRKTDFFAPPQPVYQQIPQIQSIPRIQNIPQIKNTQPLQVVEPMVQRQQHTSYGLIYKRNLGQ
jgi:hypothetical protein